MADNARLTRITGLPRPAKFKSIEDAQKAQEELYRALSEWRVDIPRPNQLSNDLYVRPEWYGAVGDGVTDDTAAIQAAVTACPAHGLVCGSHVEYLVTSIQLKSDIRFENFNLKTKAGSTDGVSAVKIGENSETDTHSNIFIRNVHVNGNRQNQTSVGTTEDGARHGFRIVGHVDNILIENCSATYCATDGIEFYSGLSTRAVGEDENTNLQTHIVVKDSRFNWNRRHGGSGDSLDGIVFDNCEFNDNGQDLNSTDALDHGNRGANTTGVTYGNGFDMEGYGIGSPFSNITFFNCEALRNVRAGILFTHPLDPRTSGYVIHDNINVESCHIDEGDGDSRDHYALMFTPGAANLTYGDAYNNVRVADNKFSGGVSLQCVDTGYVGGGIIKTSVATYVGALAYCDNIMLGPFSNPDDKIWDFTSSTYTEVSLDPILQADVTGLKTSDSPRFASVALGDSAAVAGVYASMRNLTASADTELLRGQIMYEGPLQIILRTGGSRNLDIVDGAGPTTRLTIELTTGNINITGSYQVDGVQVVSNRVVDADFANTPNSGDADTDDLIDKIRDALITHGLIASS